MPLWPAVQSSAVYYFSLALLMMPITRLSERLLSERHGAVTVAAAHVGARPHRRRRLAGIVLAHYRCRRTALLGVVFAQSWMFQLLFASAIYGMALSVDADVAGLAPRARARAAGSGARSSRRATPN